MILRPLILLPCVLTWLSGNPATTVPVRAQGIEQLLTDNIPVPSRKPAMAAGINEVTGIESGETTALVSGRDAQKVARISGSLKDGLDAVTNKDISRALGIRAGLAPGSYERKTLAWAIALSGQAGVTSGEISSIARDLSNWPGQNAMRSNAERALAREGLSANAIIRAFGNSSPVSVEGAVLLAKAHLEKGNKKAANSAIAPFWRNEKLGKKAEKTILSQVGKALNRNDHRHRMHAMFYRDHIRAANRVAGLAEQSSLAKARTAVFRKSKDASAKLKAVAASSKKDTGYLFARIEHARRSERYRDAAKLLLKAPRDQDKLVNPDEWWVERRIVSRAMLDLGDARTAYRLAAEHSAKTPSKIAEAEFHAGWYALRYLKNRRTAKRHFERILQVTSRPISQARAHYWLARSTKGSKSRDHYKQAAKYSGTFYGQLAASELGQRKLKIASPKPSSGERKNYNQNELVKAIKGLEASGHFWRADSIYRHLARTLTSPGELAILSARAEKQGKNSLALQIGKLAYQRGLAVETLAWPIGAIPKSAKIGDTGRALAYAIARQESAFNPTAVSPAKARGLLQLLPGTAKSVASKSGLKYSFKRLTSDPGYNATLGAAYLSEQMNNFGNSYILTFAGYNAGPGRVRDWLEKYGNPGGKSLEAVIDWIERIPFTETRNYVQRVMENYQIYKARIAGSRLDIKQDLVRGRR